MTISNTVSPLMVTLDRFLVGALVSMTAVTYYATPYEVVTKFLFIPVCLDGGYVPRFLDKFRARPCAYSSSVWPMRQVSLPDLVPGRSVDHQPGAERSYALAGRGLCGA